MKSFVLLQTLLFSYILFPNKKNPKFFPQKPRKLDDNCNNPDETPCTQCKSGFAIYEPFTICEQSTSKDSSSYCSLDSGKTYKLCSSQITNCDKCSNCNLCTQCKPNYAFFEGSSGCVEKASKDLSLYFSEDGEKSYELCSTHLPNCDQCSDSNTCTKCSGTYCVSSKSPNVGKCVQTVGGTLLKEDEICIFCEDVTNNCLNCVSSSECSKCKDGYCLKADGTCAQLQDGAILLDSDNTHCYICSEKISNCLRCSDVDDCEACDTNYCLKDNACQSYTEPLMIKEGEECFDCQSISNCQTCASSTECLSCKSGYCLDASGSCQALSDSVILNSDSKSCYDCTTELTNCAQCTSIGACSLCQNDYCLTAGACDPVTDSLVSNNGVCVDCTAVTPSCVECEMAGANAVCTKCESNFCLKDDKTCTSLVPDKIIFDNDGKSCYECSTKINKCDKCSTVGQCDECITSACFQGSNCIDTSPTIVKDGLDCKECSTVTSNCLKCSDPSTCTECSPNYCLTSNTCQAITSALIYDTDSISCYDCTSITSYCATCSTPGTCSSCAAGFCLSGNTCKAVTQSLILEGGLCFDCTSLTGCNTCSSSSVCTLCKSAYCLQGTSCQLTTASLIMLSGQITCFDCNTIPGCNTCTSDTVCTTCKTGFCLNPSSGCDAVSNSYIRLSTGQCYDCSSLTNCLECDGIGSCTVCAAGNCLQGGACLVITASLIALPDKTCFTCSNIQNCVECSAENHCTKCQNGYGILNNDHTKCEIISPDFYCTEDGANYMPCNDKMNGCEKCELDCSKCINCMTNYYMLDGGDDTKCDNYDINDKLIYLMTDTRYYKTCMDVASGFFCLRCTGPQQCLECSNPFVIVDNDETKCLLITTTDTHFPTTPGSTTHFTKCSTAIEKCVHCYSGTNCYECDPGFGIVKKDYKVCQPVDNTFYTHPDENGHTIYYKCSDDLEGCINCVDENTCLVCESQYTIVHGETFCRLISSLGDKYYFDNFIGKYRICHEGVGFCERCTSENHCLECQMGYAMKDDDHTTCSPDSTFKQSHYYAPKYFTEDGGVMYYTCDSHFHAVQKCLECSERATCKACLSDYAMFRGVDTLCVEKATMPLDEFFTTDDGRNYYKCAEQGGVEHCHLCNTIDECTLCDPDYAILNGEVGSECIEISTLNLDYYYTTDENKHLYECALFNTAGNCLECQDQTHCDICQSGYTIIDGNTLFCELRSAWYNNIYDLNDTHSQYCYNPTELCTNCTAADWCFICEPGYGVIEDNMTICHPVNNSFYQDDNYVFYYCNRSLEYCVECDSKTVCTKCEDGFTILKDEVLCTSIVSLGDEYYYDQDTGLWTPCSDAMEHCLRCVSKTSCTECEAPYAIKGSDKSKCHEIRVGEEYYENGYIFSCSEFGVPYCERCTDKYTCDKCQSGYAILNDNTNICHKISWITPPEEYYKTSEGFYNLCSKKIPNCLKCTGTYPNILCSECKDGYTIKDAPTSLTCTASSTIANKATYYTMDGGKHYYQCATNDFHNCAKCSNRYSCDECKTDYAFISGDFNQCVDITPLGNQIYKVDDANYNWCSDAIDNCKECSDRNNCDTCKDNFGVLNGNKDVCEAFTGNYYKVSEHEYKYCSDIKEGCDVCNGESTCYRCQQPDYALSGGDCVRPSPQGGTGYTYDGNFYLCSHGMAHCYTCLSNSYCITCETGYVKYNHEDNQCYEESKFLGNDQYYYEGGYYLSCMESSITNCKRCTRTGSLQCITCKAGLYIVNGVTNKCVDKTDIKPEDEYCSEDGLFGTVEVSTRYYSCSRRMGNCVKCIACNKCSECKEGYTILNGETSNTCRKIDNSIRLNYYTTDGGKHYYSCETHNTVANCMYCSSQRLCEKCKAGYAIIDKDYTRCTRLPNENDPELHKYYKIDDSNYMSCWVSITNCIYCDDYQTCTKCADGYTTVNEVLYRCEQISNKIVKDPKNNNYYTCEYILKGCDECTSTTVCDKCKTGYSRPYGENICKAELDMAGKYYLKAVNDVFYYHKCNLGVENCYLCTELNGVVTCNECEDYFAIVDNDKTKCYPLADYINNPLYYSKDSFKSFVKCETEIPHCLECSYNTTSKKEICTKCNDGYAILNDDPYRCYEVSALQEDNYYTVNNYNYYSCHLGGGVENCEKCSSKYSCKQCQQKGKYAIFDELEARECSLVSEKNRFNEYFSNDDGYHYIKCSEHNSVDNCLYCLNYERCEKCKEGYTFLDNVLSTCHEIAVVAPTSYKENDRNYNTCRKKMEHCISCESATHCFTCDDPLGVINGTFNLCQPIEPRAAYYQDPLDKIFYPCKSALNNCLECSDKETCTKCEDMYTLVYGENHCIKTTEIDDKYYIKDGKTKNCWFENVEFCYRCEEKGECKMCDSEHTFLNGDHDNCLPLSPYDDNPFFYTLDDKVNFYTCSNDKYHDVKYCGECQNNTICDKCLDDYAIVDDDYTKCIAKIRLVPVTSYIIEKEGQLYYRCSTLFGNCKTCSNKEICDVCADGFTKPFGEETICVDLNSKEFFKEDPHFFRCSIHHDQGKICTECEDRQNCKKCTTNHTILNDNGKCLAKTDFDRKKYYTLNNEYNFYSCNRSISNCDMCNNNKDICIKCMENYALLDDFVDRCYNILEELSDGKYYKEDGNHYKTCSKNVKNCVKCNSKDFCVECSADYTILNDKGVCHKKSDIVDLPYYTKNNGKNYYSCVEHCLKCTSDRDCVVCKEGFVYDSENIKCGIPKNDIGLLKENCILIDEQLEKDKISEEELNNLISHYMDNYRKTEYTVLKYTSFNKKLIIYLYKYSYCTQLYLEKGELAYDTSKITRELERIYGENNVVNVLVIQDNVMKFDFYDNTNGEKIPINTDETKIEVKRNYSSILANAFSPDILPVLKDMGVNVFDIEDEFFKNVCFDFTFNGIDVPLNVKVDALYLGDKNNITACGANCELVSVNLSTYLTECNCSMKQNGNNALDKDTSERTMKKYVKMNNSKMFDEMEYVISCYKDAFKSKNFKKNAGSFVVIGATGIGAGAFFMLLFVKNFPGFIPLFLMSPPKKWWSKKNGEEDKEEKGNNLPTSGDLMKEELNPSKNINIKRAANYEDLNIEKNHNPGFKRKNIMTLKEEEKNKERNYNIGDIEEENIESNGNNQLSLSSNTNSNSRKKKKFANKTVNPYLESKESLTGSDNNLDSEKKTLEKQRKQTIVKYENMKKITEKDIEMENNEEESMSNASNDNYNFIKEPQNILDHIALAYTPYDKVTRENENMRLFFYHTLLQKSTLVSVISWNRFCLTPVNIRIIKLLFILVLCVITNTLFLGQSYIKKKYAYFMKINNFSMGKKIVYALSHVVPRLIYSVLITCFIAALVTSIFSIRRKIKEILFHNYKKTITKLRKEMLELQNNTKLTFIILIIIALVLMVVFFFYQTNFGTVYHGLTIDLLVGSLISFIGVEILSVILCLLIVAFRNWGIDCEKLYHLSQILYEIN